MISEILSIRNSLNKAYLKVKPIRSGIELFKANISELLSHSNSTESEEHHKNIIATFLKKTYYDPDHYINTKGRTDLVIHNGKDSKSPVGVIIETKKPGSKSEMPSKENLNVKAFHELILYYLRERITDKNLEIKHLIATDLNEWFIFNAHEFERSFASNKKLVKDFEQFEEGTLSGTKTDFFYNEIARPFLENLDKPLQFTHFNIDDYKNIIINSDKKDDNKLITLYKIFSPEHLLKLPFSNDSNTLDRKFYNELLHIIGLEETKEGGKKLIGRKSEKSRNPESLLENTINILKSEDSLNQISKPSDFGSTQEERLYTVALELCITWINRVLFLKLLEGQLIRYHKGDEKYKFLNSELISGYDALNKLFFQVLAVKENDRNEKIKQVFGKIPYLNSSLFEPTELEQKTIRISNLDEDGFLPILSGTVIKDHSGNKVKGEEKALNYLLKFLDSYDFSSEGKEDISEENKTLINASVLGLIFEKINGYKDGSFFTPGFITMYMCRETIRRAVVQKFNDAKGLKCESIDDVYNKIEDKAEANALINGLKICDPAVGSGHFLVSALNEIIAIKSELKILTDRKGKILRDYTIEVINDELVITDEDGEFFEYHHKNSESQRIQETLFHEKQTIIENCLFGVDINQNSVKICRLRLWIELLKNAYYKPDSGFTELETLPNIDINIKCGNSLISRYPLDADIKKALQRSRWSIDSYRAAVMTYRNAESKDQKAEMRRLIDQIKSDFESEVASNDKRFLKLNKLKGELTSLTSQTSLFSLPQKEKAEWSKKVSKVTTELNALEKELEEIKNNKIYEHAFEWRFEFPEVLNNEGDFVGFDVVIGNPPYVSGKELEKNITSYLSVNYETSEYQLDLYISFMERGINVLSSNGIIAFITPNSWLKNMMFTKCRKYLLENVSIRILFPNLNNVFDEASVDTLILIAEKNRIQKPLNVYFFQNKAPIFKHSVLQHRFFENERFVFDVEINPILSIIFRKIRDNSIQLGDIAEITRGVNPYDKYRGQSEEIISSKAYHASFKKDATYLPEIRGKHISSYFYQWDGEHYISYGNWLAAPRDMKYFTGERLVLRQVLGVKLNCTIIDEDFIIDQSVFIALLKDEFKIYIKAVQGLLASTLISKYFKFTSNEFDAVFPKIKIGEFKELPIFKNLSEADVKISKLVAQVLEAKKANNSIDTRNLESAIDKIIYRLYGITDEEIEIVEEAVL